MIGLTDGKKNYNKRLTRDTINAACSVPLQRGVPGKKRVERDLDDLDESQSVIHLRYWLMTYL